MTYECVKYGVAQQKRAIVDGDDVIAVVSPAVIEGYCFGDMSSQIEDDIARHGTFSTREDAEKAMCKHYRIEYK